MAPPGIEPGTDRLRVPRRQSTITHNNSLRYIPKFNTCFYQLPAIVIRCGQLGRSGPNLVRAYPSMQEIQILKPRVEPLIA